ncbi:cation diffusion facilitator family transporter [Jeotgalibacillus sp. ET6]|uniref:cation diffusion facilitator family transporter n=1 Tax=Jeotgalibacillus sp. ET6 TaxID=3037260 RepID=UPI0024181B57|nr:cation diffusion facilitator family transporter [Jeotgalibacillus sp. ET6]MDG5473374.1 cation diffusion facilitator family transporter [Jeotgalibacillus sp. ET6]
MDLYENLKRGERGAMISIAAYLVLAVIKLVIGIQTGSEALKADGLNNTTDVIASVAVLVGLRVSRKPPDQDHHYGHMRAESIASFAAAFIMTAVAFQVLTQAGSIILQGGQDNPPSLLAAWVAIGSAIFMYGVYRYNLKLSKSIKSSSLFAAAQDNRSDALVSLGAAIGIIGSFAGLTWLDPLAAFLVGIIILKTALGIFKDAIHTLTDGFDTNEVKEIKSSVREIPGVRKIEDFKARSHGNVTFIDLTIKVDPDLNVIESHDISEEIEHALQNNRPHTQVHVHIEPDV